jgi:hypothetical protein
MANSPPYLVEGEIPASADTARLDIRVVCEPDDEEPPEPSGYKATEEVVELFEAAVNSQVWCSTASETEYARLRVVDRAWVPMPAGWLFRCEMTQVAPSSFLALLAMFTQTHYSYEPIAEVRLSGAGMRTLDADRLLMLSTPAAMPGTLPFSVNDERWNGSRGLEIGFEFIDRLTQNRFEEFQEALGIWDALRLLGGFQLDFSEAPGLPPPGRTVWMGPQTAEHSVTEFAEDSGAMAALLNLLRWQHIRGLALKSVTIS